MKKPKDMTPEKEPLRLEDVQYATGKEQRAITDSSRRNEMAGRKRDSSVLTIVTLCFPLVSRPF